MTRTNHWVAAPILFAAVACSSSTRAVQNVPSSDASSGGASGKGGTLPNDGAATGDITGGAGGAASQGEAGRGPCLVATVVRAPSDTQQPWIKASLWADGVGTLIV